VKKKTLVLVKNAELKRRIWEGNRLFKDFSIREKRGRGGGEGGGEMFLGENSEDGRNVQRTHFPTYSA